MPYINDYTEVSNLEALDLFLVETQNGTRAVSAQNLLTVMGKKVLSRVDRWLRFDPSNKKGLVVKAGTHIQLANGTVKHYTSDTQVDLSTYISTSGADYLVYLNNNGEMSAYVSSASAPANSVKIGRFHTLCANVGSINMKAHGTVSSGSFLVKPYRQDTDPDFYAFYNKTGSASSGIVTCTHPLSGFTAGSILPESVFCLSFFPDTLFEDAMVYDKATDRVIDIYLQSGTGNDTRSAYNATHTVSRQPIRHQEDMFAVGKRLLTDHEFESASIGSNEGTNITGSSDKTYVGGHVDTNSRRMISAIGCEEMCGYLWQWLDELAPTGGSGWNEYGDTNDFGKSYGMPYVLLAGGCWDDGAVCGSRSRLSIVVRSVVYAKYGGRGSSRVVRSK